MITRATSGVAAGLGLSAVVALSLCVGGCAGVARSRIYLPAPLSAVAPAWRGRAPEPVRATTADGLTLAGYYWPPSAPGGDVIVFLHGNAGNALTAAQMAEPLARDGHGVMVASYRGYGANPGRPSESGLMQDGAAFLRLARERAPGSRIYLFGYSLGSAVALELAAREEVAGVVTLGAFASLADAAPAWSRGLLPDRFDNVAAIRRVQERVLILHGTADEVVPFPQARVLAAAAPDRTRLLTLEGAPHRVALDKLAPVVWENLQAMSR